MITRVDADIFFLVKFQDCGALAWVGDKGLAPVRYLFNGVIFKRIPFETNLDLGCHVIASFSSNPASKTPACGLVPSSTGKIRTLFAVLLLIPGFVLSVFKLLAYVFSQEIRSAHTDAASRISRRDCINRWYKSYPNHCCSCGPN